MKVPPKPEQYMSTISIPLWNPHTAPVGRQISGPEGGFVYLSAESIKVGGTTGWPMPPAAAAHAAAAEVKAPLHGSGGGG